MTRIRRLRRGAGAVPLGLGALCFALAFAQRPGKAYVDSRIELSADPVRFLGRVGDVWSSTGDLGHVQSGLFAGYLFPMAPYYAVADAVGVPIWVAQRLWLGLLLAVAAWGAVRLVRALAPGTGAAAGWAAGLVYAFSPYVITSIAVRGSVPLLAYAALPWLLLCVRVALAEPHRWRAPAAAGLLVAASGGAINAAYVLWMLLGAAALVLYEVVVLRAADRRALWPLAWRSATCILGGSAWWLVPLALQAGFGGDFQQFAEHPGAIWQTTSIPESLRLLGFWVLYLGSGFAGAPRAELDVGADLLFSPPVVVASFVIPLLALGGLRLTRDWRYAAFWGLLAVGAVLVMAAGFPPESPLRRALLKASEEVRWLEIVRTTYKAAPLAALALAMLCGVAMRELPRWAPAALSLVVLVAALPLVKGRAIDSDVAYGSVPEWWRAAVTDAERVTPAGRRIMVLPGALWAYYRWGFTTTSVAPALTDRPVAVRETIRYPDPRSAQLLDVTDELVQQDRAVPGQLPQLLALLGVGRVLVGSDGDPRRTGELPPADAARALAAAGGFERPLATFGPSRRHAPLVGHSGSAVTLPAVRAYPGPRDAPAHVRLLPAAGAIVLDGDADGVAELAAHGALDSRRALHYAGDLDARALRELIAGGAELVFTDSGRRRALSPGRLRNNHGATLAAAEEIPAEAARFDLFARGGHATVAAYSGIEALTSRVPAGRAQFPQYRAFAAFDRQPATAWVPRGADGDESLLLLRFSTPRPVAAIRVRPLVDRSGRTRRIGIAVNGGPRREFGVRPGANTVRLDARSVRSLAFSITGVESARPERRSRGGIAEVAIAGLRVRERLRLPGGLAAAARRLPLGRTPMTVLLQRTTADFPYRAGVGVKASQPMRQEDMVDAEPGLEREVTLPVARTFTLDGWASADPAGNDPALDALAGMEPGWEYSSSSRFEGLPRRRASSAFDGDPRTAWVGDWPNPRAWISVRAPHPFAARSIQLVPGPREYAIPARVHVRAGGARVARDLEVDSGGRVDLPALVRTRSLRVAVAAVRRPAPARRLDGVAIAELRVGALAPAAPRRAGRFRTSCGAIRVSGARTLVEGSVRDLDAGRPLRLRGCGAGLALAAGRSLLRAPPGPAFRADHLRLASGPARPRAAGAGAVVDPGRGGDGRRDGVRLRVTRPSWLVLGESYSRGWRAWCGDEPLGPPIPIAGFANGWRVGRSCRDARFAYSPQRAALAGYVLSGAAVLALVLVLVLSLVRGREAIAPASGAGPAPPRAALSPGSWRRALAVAAVVGLVGGLAFALRAGVVLAPAALLLARRGVDSRRLFGAAAFGLAALPVVYLAFPPEDRGGHNIDFGVELMGAHWIGVGVIWALGLGCALEVRARRRA